MSADPPRRPEGVMLQNEEKAGNLTDWRHDYGGISLE